MTSDTVDIDWYEVRQAISNAMRPHHEEVVNERGDDCVICEHFAAAHLAAMPHLIAAEDAYTNRVIKRADQ